MSYIETDTGNRISRANRIQGSKHILIGGKTTIEAGAEVRGDLHRKSQSGAIVAIGRYCYLGVSCSITPPERFSTSANQMARYPVTMGSYVTIGDRTQVQAGKIGSHVYIGADCILGEFCIIRDCVKIEAGTVVPPFAVVAPFSHLAGNPARRLDMLPESAEIVLELHARKQQAGLRVEEPFRMEF